MQFYLKRIGTMTSNDTTEYKTYMCLICGFIYDEAVGVPDEGIQPGTRWEDVPINWVCPECGARKDDFELVEI
jgi:rubredoxin